MSRLPVKRHPTAWLVGMACGLAAAPLLAAALPVARWLSAPLVESDPLRRVDAIVVLGAGTYDDTTLTPDSAYRLLHGLALFLQGYAPIIILSGGGHRGSAVTDGRAMPRVATSLSGSRRWR